MIQYHPESCEQNQLPFANPLLYQQQHLNRQILPTLSFFSFRSIIIINKDVKFAG